MPTPTEVAHISIDPAATLALGGVFPPEDSRVLVHAKLVILALTQAGFYAPPDKMLIGDPITSLGFSINRADNRLRVPELKRAALLSSIATFRRGAHRGEPIVRKEAESLVGKLLNISQVAPELKPFLAAGYRVTNSGFPTIKGGVKFLKRPRLISMKVGSDMNTLWLELLTAAEGMLLPNEGVPLAPKLHFPKSREHHQHDRCERD